MLEILGVGPLAADDYLIVHTASGQDSVRLRLSRRDRAAASMQERTRVKETASGQIFLVEGIDAGQKTAEYVLKKDLSEWKRAVFPGYRNHKDGLTAEETVRGVLPEGWTLKCAETDNLRAVIELQGPTALGVTEQCMEVFGCGFVFDNVEKTVTMHFPGKKALGTAVLAETANLRQAPEFKSKAGSLVTRLYAQGAGGVDFAEINGGKPYVECFEFTDEVVAGFWRDERFTIPEHLLLAAQEKIKNLAWPERRWSVSAADLHALDGERWPGLRLGLFDVVRLIDPTLGQRLDVQIMEKREYPHHPEKNELEITGRGGAIVWRQVGVRR